MDVHYFTCDLCHKFQDGPSLTFIYHTIDDDCGGLYLTSCEKCWNSQKVKYLIKNVKDFDKYPFFKECQDGDLHGILEEIEKILKQKEGSNG